MCYSVVIPCGYCRSRTSPALASNGNTRYSVMGVKRHIMPVDLPESESITVSNGVLFCNLAEQICVEDQMSTSKHWHEVTGFLSWIGTYRIGCVVQRSSKVKDLYFLVR